MNNITSTQIISEQKIGCSRECPNCEFFRIKHQYQKYCIVGYGFCDMLGEILSMESISPLKVTRSSRCLLD